jgi:glucose-1-phosphate cytidylyltransferase
MKAVILAGGRGSRLAEETGVRPKPLVEVGGRPIIWHIMNIYAHHGVTDFVVCAGYKGYMLKEYFANLALHGSDVTFDLGAGTVEYHQASPLPWRVTVVDTGIETMTGGRLRRVREYLNPDEPFFLTYGDGVADIDVNKTLAVHRDEKALVTLTAVKPRARFGTVVLDGADVTDMLEKHPTADNPVNGGFFVVDPEALDLVDGDASIWESDVLPQIADMHRLAAYRHEGFWQPMDLVWEKDLLESLWNAGEAPWKVW